MTLDVHCPIEHLPQTHVFQEVKVSEISHAYAFDGLGASNSTKIRYSSTVAPVMAKAYTANSKNGHSEVKVADLSREEFEARVAQNNAEIKLSQHHSFSSIDKTLVEIKSEIGSLRSEMSGLREGFNGKFEGINSSISTTQWMLGTILTILGIGVAILAIPGIEKIF